jgi:hypothetical protein
MTDILLTTPEFYLYLGFVVALLIAALWTREAGAPVDEPGATGPTAGRGGGGSVFARGKLGRGPFRSFGRQPQRGRPFRDLQATLSAGYAAKLEQAIRMIRIDPPAG